MTSIDLNAVHALRGYEVQHYIALQGLFYILSLDRKFYDEIRIEGEEDIVLRGPNRKKFIQVKKKEPLGQWAPQRISRIAYKMFFKWSDSISVFDEMNCRDTFYIAIQGDLSPSLFNMNENTSNCIINLEKLFEIPTNKSLKSTSMIKKKIIHINKTSKNRRGYEAAKLNYFIRNLRICVNLPPLEDLKHVVISRINDYLKTLTSGLTIKRILELIKYYLDEIKNKATSTEPLEHIFRFDDLYLKFIEFLEQNLDSYIENLARHRDVELPSTVLKEKILKANGDVNTVNNSIRLKNTFLVRILSNQIDFFRLKLLYSEYINWIRKVIKSSEKITLSKLNLTFIEKNEDLFKNLENIKDIHTLKGLYYDLASYCTLGMEGFTDVS